MLQFWPPYPQYPGGGFRRPIRRVVKIGDIVGTLLTAFEDNVDGSAKNPAETYDTVSFTPTAGRKQFAVVVQSGTTNNLPSSLTGNGLTWTERLTNNKGGATVAMGLYEATAGTPVAGVMRAVFQAGDLTTGVHIHVVEFAGVDLVTPIVVTNTVSSSATASTGQTVTLPNAMTHVKNAHFYMMTRTANEVTGSDDFTELSDNAHASPNRALSTGYKLNDLTAALTWTSSVASRWMGVELRAAA